MTGPNGGPVQIHGPGSVDFRMFLVTEADADAIRAIFNQEGELSAAIELRLESPTTRRRGHTSGQSPDGSRHHHLDRHARIDGPDGRFNHRTTEILLCNDLVGLVATVVASGSAVAGTTQITAGAG